MSGPLSALASPVRPSAPDWLPWLSGGVPLAFYIAIASAHRGLSEEGAFVAAARELGVSHAPGAPLSHLVSALFALLPAGPLAFRVSVGAAVCVAALLALFARAVFFSLLGAGVRDARRAAPLALAAAWFAAQLPVVYEQALRPNVFALQFALSMVVLEALTRFELSEPTEDTRTLYFAAFVQGLCFANHHVLGLLMLAPAMPTLGRLFARRGFIGLMGHIAFPILGFSAYVYVPIRASQHPALNYGDASGLRNLSWMLNADPFWGPNYVPAGSMPRALWEGLGRGSASVAGLVLALTAFALWCAARSSALRRFALVWAIAVAVPLASVSLVLTPRLRADAWGALMPCTLGLVALAASGLGLLLQRLTSAERLSRSFRRAPAWALSTAALLGLANAAQGAQARPQIPEAFDDLTRRNLPARAVLLTYDPSTTFRHFGAEAEEQLRPDVTLVPLHWLDVPGTAAGLRAAYPELARLLDVHRAQEQLMLPALQALAAKRPVLLELGEQVPANLLPAFHEDGWFQRVSPRGQPATEAGAASAALERLRAARTQLPPELALRLDRLQRLRTLAQAP